TRLRARAADRDALLAVLDGMIGRAWRRLQPFELAVGSVTLEIERAADHGARRNESFEPALETEDALRDALRAIAEPLLAAPAGVRALHLRLGRLASPGRQTPL